MGKSNRWYLIRLECDREFRFYLNEGDTKIGRNKVADVIIKSNICSRNHCVVTLDSNENIVIKNEVIALFFFHIPRIYHSQYMKDRTKLLAMKLLSIEPIDNRNVILSLLRYIICFSHFAVIEWHICQRDKNWHRTTQIETQ